MCNNRRQKTKRERVEGVIPPSKVDESQMKRGMNGREQSIGKSAVSATVSADEAQAHQLSMD